MEDKAISFRLIKTTIDEFAVFNENFGFITSVNELIYNSNITFEIARDTLQLSCISSVTCVIGEKIIFKCSVRFVFEFNPASIEANIADGDTFEIPRETVVYLASKTYGALRGVLMAKLDTYDLHIILPMIDLSKIIKGSFSIQVKKH